VTAYIDVVVALNREYLDNNQKAIPPIDIQ